MIVFDNIFSLSRFLNLYHNYGILSDKLTDESLNSYSFDESDLDEIKDVLNGFKLKYKIV